MRTSISTASITRGDSAGQAQKLVTAVCFGPESDPPSLADQELELRIQAEGLLMQAEMLAWRRSGEFFAHRSATQHQNRMVELINCRSEAMQARMAQERGLPHA